MSCITILPVTILQARHRGRCVQHVPGSHIRQSLLRSIPRNGIQNQMILMLDFEIEHHIIITVNPVLMSSHMILSPRCRSTSGTRYQVVSHPDTVIANRSFHDVERPTLHCIGPTMDMSPSNRSSVCNYYITSSICAISCMCRIHSTSTPAAAIGNVQRFGHERIFYHDGAIRIQQRYHHSSDETSSHSAPKGGKI